MAIIKNLVETIKNIANIDAHIDTDAAEHSIRNNIEFKGPNAWILAVAIIIASVGLNVNSIPVIIGAMLISPLMGPIFGLGLGLGINDISLMKQAGKNLLVMVSISVAVSFLYFLIYIFLCHGSFIKVVFFLKNVTTENCYGKRIFINF